MNCENWNSIVAECEQDINKYFIDSQQRVCRFLGVLLSLEDYYYLMYYPSEDKYMFLSCVGNLEDHEYKLLDESVKVI